MDDKIRIGISVGDINGVGLEVILKTISPKTFTNLCIPVLYATNKVVSYHQNVTDISDFELQVAPNANSLNPNMVNIINCWEENVAINLGTVSEIGGKYAVISLEKATQDLLDGHIDALVTAPIHKKSMELAGFGHVGHTEYLTEKMETKQSLMLLINDTLRVGLVTNHIPIKEVSGKITKGLILEKINILHETLQMDFGIDKPKIAVLGLNPHAGDGGVIGQEEMEHIIPALDTARNKGIIAIGPYPADGFFGSGNYLNFDAILAMYHDQGLAPFKALSFGTGYNYTAGLPFIRTSPDHGTAFDIAGQNKADESSFRTAMFAAIDILRNRRAYHERYANPLQRQELQAENLNAGVDKALRRHNDNFTPF
jgi:4-hydroxythreonine-4-phosphate dehydrogenase